MQLIYDSLKAELEQLENILNSTVEAMPVIIKEPLRRFLINKHSKRIRPIVLFLSYYALAEKDKDKAIKNSLNKRLINLATGIELIHSASLIHDDVIDEAKIRRGCPTINTKLNNKLAILSGDYLYTKAIELFISDADFVILNIIATAVKDMCEGEIYQDIISSEEEYIEIISKKTGSLFSACCLIGAYLANNNYFKDKLRIYGKNLGIAYQIRDDLLDIIGEEDKLAKSLSSDIKLHKLSLPIFYLKKKNCYIDYEDISILRKMIHQEGAVAYTKKILNKYIKAAKEAIKELKDSCAFFHLTFLLDFINDIP